MLRRGSPYERILITKAAWAKLIAEIQKLKKKKKKKNTFKPIGNREYSEILEKEINCAKNPQKKGLTILKRLLQKS